MGAESHKDIVRRAIEEPWRGDLAVIDELVAHDYVGHDPSQPEPMRGPQGFKEFVSTYKNAFRDARVTVDAQFGDGEFVATRWTGRGIHEGELMGIAPTGREATVTGITISRVSQGKIVEEWTNWDTLGLLTQLGVVQQPVEA